MRATATRAALLVSALVLLGACGGGSAATTTQPRPSNASSIVDIRDISFNPKSVRVKSGQVVAWKFDDESIAHNVTGNGWASPDRTSGYYTHTFTAPGTYAYRCTIHSNMEGQVVVAP